MMRSLRAVASIGGARAAVRATPVRVAAHSRRHMSAGVLTVDNPYTGETAAQVQLSTADEALAKVAAAADVQRTWARVPLDDRLDLCERFIDAMTANSEAVAQSITAQMGKPLAHARGEINGLVERARGMMALAPTALADEVLPEKPGFYRKIAHEPVGVVLVVAPWNYPLLTAVNTIVPAILAGNSVVIKHSSRTPLCAEAFADAFALAGAPAGLVTALHCGHSVVDTVIRDERTAFVAFTGSVPGGHTVYQSVASRFIDATLELGGKDPAYVAEDADLEHAIACVADGGYFNAGQSCCGIERVYVHESRYEAFVEGLLEQVKGHRLGDPMAEGTTMGPLAQDNACDFLAGQVADATAKGARLLHGGAPCTDDAGKGRFFAPTLLADCNHDMNIMVEESFGPVLGVMPVSGDEEAVKMMNDSPYGLTAALFTQDQDKALRIGAQIETGTVFQNRCDYLDPELPWTGVKDTGKGVSLSHHGFRGVTRLKGYHLKQI